MLVCWVEVDGCPKMLVDGWFVEADVPNWVAPNPNPVVVGVPKTAAFIKRQRVKTNIHFA